MIVVDEMWVGDTVSLSMTESSSDQSNDFVTRTAVYDGTCWTDADYVRNRQMQKRFRQDDLSSSGTGVDKNISPSCFRGFNYFVGVYEL